MDNESKKLIASGICPICYTNVAIQKITGSKWFLIKQEDDYIYVIYDLGELVEGQSKKGVIHCSSDIPQNGKLFDHLPDNFCWICHNCYDQFKDAAQEYAKEEEKKQENQSEEIKDEQESTKTIRPLWFDYIEKWSTNG